MLNRTRRRIVILFAAATFLAVTFAVYLSLDPDKYFFYRPEDRATWVYHPDSVALLCALMLFEAGVACVAVAARCPRVLWLRGLLGLVVLLPWAWYSTMIFLHTPFYVLFHHIWVWLMVLVLGLAAVGSGMAHFCVGVRRKTSSNHSLNPESARGSGESRL
jgi:hypothetical protein